MDDSTIPGKKSVESSQEQRTWATHDAVTEESEHFNSGYWSKQLNHSDPKHTQSLRAVLWRGDLTI